MTNGNLWQQNSALQSEQLVFKRQGPCHVRQLLGDLQTDIQDPSRQRTIMEARPRHMGLGISKPAAMPHAASGGTLAPELD